MSTDKLHTAICRAVEILNVAPDVVRITEGRKVHDILRAALAEYADDFMDQPVQADEREAIHKKHRKGSVS